MCGLVGFLGFSATGNPQHVIHAMTEAIVHRGPDAGAHWVDEAAEIALGHRRLAIVDLSPAGAQPMASTSGRYIMVFNGEIYNHPRLRAELDAAGASGWRGHSDTETLLAGFDRWGIAETIRRCIGMFALAVWDRKHRMLTLIRDRMGEKPLYFGWLGAGAQRTFVFGSELKALRAHPAFDARIDRAALKRYAERMVLRGSSTIYDGLRKVSPGAMVVLDAVSAEPREEIYWSVAEAAERGLRDRFTGSPEDAVRELETILSRAVAGQMVADVPLGAFLSGGVDSSMIVALMQAQSAAPVRSFTIGFDQTEYDEAPHAKAVARHLGTDHTELYVDARQARDLIPRLARIYDEPFADSSALPTMLVSQMARQHVTVALSGDGGDELFCGYRRYTDARGFWRRTSAIPRPLRGIGAGLIGACPAGMLNAAGRLAGMPHLGDKLKKGAPLLASVDQDDLYQRLLRAWPGRNPVILDPDAPRMDWALRDRIDAPLAPMEQFMLSDMVGYLPDDILTKVDRAAMAVSLETRVPMLDHQVVEFALRLPLACKLRETDGKTVTKWALRQVLYRHVPPQIIERPKRGFAVPLAQWLRDDLRDWAEDLLDEQRLRSQGYFDAKLVRDLWAQHLKGQRNWQAPLWAILMFQAWLSEWPAAQEPAAHSLTARHP